nr:PREDICTED: receptor like protein 30-like [Daucus carota subsp. sativus]
MIMKNFISCFFALIVMLIFFVQCHQVASLSPHSQKIALFRFKQSFKIAPPSNCSYFSYFELKPMTSHLSHPKTMNWSMSSDHCTWEGVSCDQETGDVIGLDLSCGQLQGAILPNSTLFQLSRLRFLNLSQNDFILSTQFPREFGFFAKGLTHLNLSGTGISARVPSEISHLYNLVSLDLSRNYFPQLDEEVFKSLMQNLTHLRVLNLQWFNIPSVLPVNISTSLRVLNLGGSFLLGKVPQEVFNLPNLEALILSYNFNLTAKLPEAKWGSSATLQHLDFSYTNIDGGIPDSIGHLESLDGMELTSCNLSGPVPRSIGHLS